MKLNYWLIALCCLGTWNVSAQEKVECWGRFELPLQAKVKGNPFDAELTATFEGPDTTITVRGFYDGNNTFKIRFMPVKQGKWSYKTQSKVEALNGKSGSLQIGRAHV